MTYLQGIFMALITTATIAPGNAIFSKKGGKLAADNARFTVITPTCIRLEYVDRAAFKTGPSFYAIDRSNEYSEFTATENKVTNSRFRRETYSSGPGRQVICARKFIHTSSRKWRRMETKPATPKILGDLVRWNQYVIRWQEIQYHSGCIISRNGWYVIEEPGLAQNRIPP